MARRRRMVSHAHELIEQCSEGDLPSSEEIQKNYCKVYDLLQDDIEKLEEAMVLLKGFVDKYSKPKSKFNNILRSALIESIQNEAELFLAVCFDSVRLYYHLGRLDMVAKHTVEGLQLARRHDLSDADSGKRLREVLDTVLLNRRMHQAGVQGFRALQTGSLKLDDDPLLKTQFESLPSMFETLVGAGYLHDSPLGSHR